ncbi:MAG: glutamate-1-semialdehyde-2,1-aminomutase [Gammaproteobacteria bacterium]|nr:glutamate-1-semialdehyde-2,1-aminomutase [Gammaproteobacteria bacterium]|tara:strand:- start:31277 stop:32566 length:1290 start_codon:yes stop_codon:yes gene_type:complete
MKKSNQQFNRAKKCMPGGVNSPVRSFKSVKSSPFIVSKAKGSSIYDVDGSKYIDYVNSWGAQILGHTNSEVIKTISNTLKKGLSYGAPCTNEILLAEKICKIFPSIEKIRMVNSGTEATMSAIRLARGFSKKDKIIKFDGGYHGHGDSFLIKSGSGMLTLGKPNSLGVTKSLAKDTISIPYNNISRVDEAIKKNKNNIACVIIEPIAGNMNFVRSTASFLKELRQICTKYKIILIFDEVMTGFRVALGGAQSIYQIKPDLTTLGKVIGGGLPIGAFGGKTKIMNCLAPMGDVYQAGTLSGNPIAMAAGLKTLSIISKKNFYSNLHKKLSYLFDNLNRYTETNQIHIHADYEGGMFGLYFNENKKIKNYNDICKSNSKLFIKFHQYMIKKGIFFAPSMFEAGFISISHSLKEIEYTKKCIINFIDDYLIK